jgi:hypothetical protein
MEAETSRLGKGERVDGNEIEVLAWETKRTVTGDAKRNNVKVISARSTLEERAGVMLLQYFISLQELLMACK